MSNPCNTPRNDVTVNSYGYCIACDYSVGEHMPNTHPEQEDDMQEIAKKADEMGMPKFASLARKVAEITSDPEQESLRSIIRLCMDDHFRNEQGINLGQYKTEYTCNCGFKYITDGHNDSEPGNYTRQKEHELDILMHLIEQDREQAVREARIEGIIEALNGVTYQHYGYKGELVIDTYLSMKDKLRPEGENPAFSLPVLEAIEFYKNKLTQERSKDA